MDVRRIQPEPNEEIVYAPIQPVQPVQPVYQTPVQPVQPVYQQPVQPVQPVYQQVVQPVYQPEADTERSYSEMGNLNVEHVRQGYYDQDGNLMQREEQIVDDPGSRRLNILDRATRIFYFLVGALEILLALRFLLRVINAGSGNGLVNFIYNLSAPFVAPFNGIFNDQSLTKGSVFEFSTLIAMGVYAILLFGLVKFMYVLFEPGRNTRQVFSTTRRRRY